VKTIEKRELAALRKKLRSFRSESGWTFHDLSRRCGASVTSLCEFESGVCGMRPDKLALVEKILRRALRSRATRIARLLNSVQTKPAIQKPDRVQILAEGVLRSKPTSSARTEKGAQSPAQQQTTAKKMPEAI
jgi:transcriptional regulator with XRE-family HTH domain